MNLNEKKFFLLDMDGTIYLDMTLFDGTIDFLEKVKKKQGRYLFVTNNSSRNVRSYVEKLHKIGIDACEEDFLTSTEATILYLKEYHPGQKFYSFGTESFTKQLRDKGIDVVTELCDGITGLVIANDTEMTFKKFDDASRLLTQGVDFVATNPDWVCPTSYGYVPDCGSFCQMLEHATGKSRSLSESQSPKCFCLR